jgi:hypothetical protein
MRLTLKTSMTDFLRVKHLRLGYLHIILSFGFCLFRTSTVHAYPDFIAYGYRSCLTCHFNGDGGGALNDYGRGVWASEIVSKSIFHRNTSDEKMSENSGALGSKQLPWWFRPGFKARELLMISDPGSKKSVERFIDMQRELNAAFFFDKDQKLMFYGSYGYRPLPAKYEGVSGKKPEEWISREHYFRWQQKENLFLYAGSMDKVFGIKNVDHTSFGRTKTRTTMDDQVHAVKAQYVTDQYDLFAQVFVGNLAQDEKLREQGVAIKIDKSYSEKSAWGASFMTSKNEYVEKIMASAELRVGLRNPGNGFIGEIGFVQDKKKSEKALLGYYTLFENMIRIVRGYHMLATFENYKPDITSSSSESYRYGVGMLAFPWTRTEFRVQLLNYRTLVPGQANPDTWILFNQLHLSF